MSIRHYEGIDISGRTEGMVDASASQYQESGLFYYMQNAMGLEYDRIEDATDDLVLQLSPYTATWGLIYWEEAVGLPRRPNIDCEIRRPLVLNRLLNSQNFSASLIKKLGTNYGEDIRVELNPSEFLVTVTFQRGVPTFLEDFQGAVESIVHAHYGVEYKFEYIIKGGLTVTTRYSRFLYDVPKAGPSQFCGTIPGICTEGRVYRANLQLEGKVEETLTDYKTSGTYASGPLPFVSVEGKIYRTALTTGTDGTITVTAYKQAGEADAGTVPMEATEGVIYRGGIGVNSESEAALSAYTQVGTIYSGGVRK